MPAPDDIPTTGETIRLEPHWPGLRRYVVALAKSGELAHAREIASAMGCEAPDLSGFESA